MFLRFTLITLSFITCLGVLSQKERLEKAKKAVDTLFFVDKEKGLEISEFNLIESYAVNDTFYITYFLDQAGEINRYFGNFYKAEKQLKECLLYKQNWEDLKDLSLTHNNLGKTYKAMAEYDQALYHFLEALKLMEIDSNLIGQSFYLNNIGTLFDEQQNYEKAIEYYNRSLEIKRKLGQDASVSGTQLNIGISFFNMKKYDNALDYFNRALASEDYQTKPNKKANALANIGKTYALTGKMEQAKKVLLHALELQEQIDDATILYTVKNTLTTVLTETNQLDSAAIFANEVIKATKNKGAVDKLQEAYFNLSTIYEKKKSLDSALIYLKEGNLYYDSLVSEANIHAVTEMETKYKTERNLRLKNEAKLDAINAKNDLQAEKVNSLYLLIGLILVLAVGIFFFLKNRANKKNADLLAGQKALILSQNNKLSRINDAISIQLDELKISIAEKDNLLENVFSKSQNEDLPPELLSLSKREKEVLANLALGLSDDQLAEKLFVSKSTVKTHLRRVYSKLLVKNRAQAVAIAHKYGIIGEV